MSTSSYIIDFPRLLFRFYSKNKKGSVQSCATLNFRIQDFDNDIMYRVGSNKTSGKMASKIIP